MGRAMTQYDDSGDSPSSSAQVLVQLLMILVVLFGIGIALFSEFALGVSAFVTGGAGAARRRRILSHLVRALKQRRPVTAR
ncbi:MAG: hypothetical protein ACREE7_07715 [Dongiaceae bacterium]